MTNTGFTHVNECNVSRALEVFMVAHKICSHVTLKVVGLPKTGGYDNMYNLVKGRKPNLLMQASIEYEMSNVLKGPHIEPVSACFDRAMNYRNSSEMPTESLIAELVGSMTAPSKNLLKVASGKLSFKADTVSAVYIVAGAIAFMEGSKIEIRVEHIAEAVQYYVEMRDPVTRAFEILEKVNGKAATDRRSLKEARTLLLSRINY